jgi:hypothetical protein
MRKSNTLRLGRPTVLSMVVCSDQRGEKRGDPTGHPFSFRRDFSIQHIRMIFSHRMIRARSQAEKNATSLDNEEVVAEAATGTPATTLAAGFVQGVS